MVTCVTSQSHYRGIGQGGSSPHPGGYLRAGCSHQPSVQHQEEFKLMRQNCRKHSIQTTCCTCVLWRRWLLRPDFFFGMFLMFQPSRLTRSALCTARDFCGCAVYVCSIWRASCDLQRFCAEVILLHPGLTPKAAWGEKILFYSTVQSSCTESRTGATQLSGG